MGAVVKLGTKLHLSFMGFFFAGAFTMALPGKVWAFGMGLCAGIVSAVLSDIWASTKAAE